MGTDRDDILAEIRRTAVENEGRPLGRSRFQQVTGISEYDIGRHWARFGDAVREAGLEPNQLNPAFEEHALLDLLVTLTRKLGNFPTRGELRLERALDQTFPSPGVFERLGPRSRRIELLLDHCRRSGEHTDVIRILESAAAASDRSLRVDPEADVVVPTYGFVYLVEGHRGEYKVGRTNLVDRRVSELGVASAVEHRTRSRRTIPSEWSATGTYVSPKSACVVSGSSWRQRT